MFTKYKGIIFIPLSSKKNHENHLKKPILKPISPLKVLS